MGEENIRPWGKYENLYSHGNTFLTKEIIILPGKRFSLQLHNKREETWYILKGSGRVTLGDSLEDLSSKDVFPEDKIYIPKKKIHRAEAYEGLVFFEVQMGFPDENDIVRFEDDFGRVLKK